MFLVRIAALFWLLSVLFGQRLPVWVSGNPLDGFAVAFVLFAFLAWMNDKAYWRPQSRWPGLVTVTVGPLFGLLLVLPLLGVLSGNYGVTVLYAWMLALVPMGMLSLSQAGRLREWRLERLAFWAIVVHGAYGAGQTLYRLGLMPAQLWQDAAQWDLDSQAAFSDDYQIAGRSTGLFINANQFGLWSVSALLLSVVALRGPKRVVAVLLCVFGVIGSQSRTAWAGLVVLAVAGLWGVLRSRRAAGTAVVWAFIGGTLAACLGALGVLTRLIEVDLVDRLASGASVAQGGEDKNLSARMEAWASAIDFTSGYPFGTWGPPQSLFGSFIDNQYVSLYMQGSVLLVLAYVMALMSPLALRRRGVPHAPAMGAASVLVVLASFTMLPLDSPMVAAPIWLLAAYGLSRSRPEGVEPQPLQDQSGSRDIPVAGRR